MSGSSNAWRLCVITIRSTVTSACQAVPLGKAPALRLVSFYLGFDSRCQRRLT